MGWGRWTRTSAALAGATLSVWAVACGSDDDDDALAAHDSGVEHEPDSGGDDDDLDASPAAPDAGVDAGPDGPEVGDFTFFVWGDLHVVPDDDYHLSATEGANELPGLALPDDLGGAAVGEPDFILDCGDMVEWPSVGAVDEYFRIVDAVSLFPVWPVLGNHDLVSTSGSATMENSFLERFTDTDVRVADGDAESSAVGERSYSFVHEGIAFVGLSETYSPVDPNPDQAIPAEDLAWIAGELAHYGAETPIVVWLHLGWEAITNLPDVTAVLDGYRIALVLGGHFHHSAETEIDGYPFIQVGSPKPGEDAQPHLLVVRIQDGALTAVFWDYGADAWADEPTVTASL